MLLCHLLRVAARLELCGIILLCYSMFLIMISDLVCWFVSLILCPPARDPSSALMFLSALKSHVFWGLKNKQTNNQKKDLRIQGKRRRKGDRRGNTGICGKIWILLMLLKELRESLENKLKSCVLDFILMLGPWGESCQSLLVLVMPFRTCGIHDWIFYLTLRFTFWTEVKE